VTPLREQIASLEGSISGLEAKIVKLEQDLASASEKANGVEIRRVSQELAVAQSELQGAMSAWESAERKRTDVEAEFEARLRVLGESGALPDA